MCGLLKYFVACRFSSCNFLICCAIMDLLNIYGDKNMEQRAYYARELVTFAKYVADQSRSGNYLLIGYLNNNKTKFRDIASGRVYSLKEIVTHPGKPGYPESASNKHQYKTPAIEIDGQAFVQVEMGVETHDRGLKGRVINFSNPCIFTKVYVDPFKEINGKVAWPNIYDFVEKSQDPALFVVTTTGISRAIREANNYANCWLYSSDEKGNGEREPFLIDHYPSLTERERDF